ncbi:Tetraacyldisaccharide 4'-kinase [hydrothermal vent metagenome]|uniref:tetraacyldisaccharide 4'-kinase n=1 Tax=hydrothermal vent metagenome TaxID=652676 RepID=A0A3B0X7H2_9ZZZZ
MKSLEHYWYESSPLVWLLLPISALYCLIIGIRRQLYKLKIKPSFSVDVPVIIIGNIVAGGSGKTPLLISLCEYARNNGLTPGVVSRGYGGSFSGLKQVAASDKASLVGDEPLMIYQKANVPVVVGLDRVAAINFLLEHNQCNVIFSDDGLQHYRMKRNFEIAVVDSSRRFGNGFCLPAGPLREPVSRLKDVDMVVYNATGSLDAEQCSYSLQFSTALPLKGGEVRLLSVFENKTVHAVAGIGHPMRFFKQLRAMGVSVVEHAFSDHHQYQADDFAGWQSDCIIMTEKDAIKCSDLLLPDAWVVNTSVQLSSALKVQLDAMLLPVMSQSTIYEKET